MLLAAETSQSHIHLFSVPIHIVHILIGLVVAIVILVPLTILYFRRYKKKGIADVTQGKRDISSEKIKSNIIINAIDDGVVMIDSTGTVQLFNPGAEKVSGWSAAETVGLDYRLIFKLINEKGEAYPEDKHPISQTFTSSLAIRDNKAIMVTKSGKQIAIDVSVSPLLESDSNKLSGAVVIFRDVSSERSEEQRRAEFISTASHEMRTPVAAIEGYLALALNENVSKIDSKARSFLLKAHESTSHLGKLFQDLLTSAKAEDGRLVSHPVPLEMSEFLVTLSDSLRFSAEKKGLLLDFVLGAPSGENVTNGKVIKPLYYINADPDRLREVITNLFDNAVKYTESGRISLGLTGNKDIVQFYIKDTGPGIAKEDVPHLFQKFYRVDNSSTRTIGGTGLGLFICRKIVELYNGRIWVESEIGKGSTFFINLPRISSARAQELQAKEASQPNPSPVLPKV